MSCARAVCADAVDPLRLPQTSDLAALAWQEATRERCDGRAGTTLMSELRSMTDGCVVLRPPHPGDEATLIAGRDEVFHRWLGSGHPAPHPSASIEVHGEVVGWVDYDVDRAWLESGEVNVGYNVFAAHRGRGTAARSVALLMHHLAVRTEHTAATLLIDPGNEPSLAVAERAGFVSRGEVNGQGFWRRQVPPLTYTDGVVTIRPRRLADLDADLEAKDDEQIDWLWLPGHREEWEAMTPAQQRSHAHQGLVVDQGSFGTGPKWTFAVDAPTADYVAYMDCDLANEHVPTGEANVSYAAHPAHRGQGYVSRALRLVVQFLRDHTGAREAHVIVDATNVASLRVPAALGAEMQQPWVNGAGRTMLRHVLAIDRSGSV